MPITSSAKKALRASKKKRVFNLRRKSEIEQQMKSFKKAVSEKDQKGAEKMIPNIYQALDKAVKTGLIKSNKSARMKSRVMATLNKLKK